MSQIPSFLLFPPNNKKPTEGRVIKTKTQSPQTGFVWLCHMSQGLILIFHAFHQPNATHTSIALAWSAAAVTTSTHPCAFAAAA